VNPNVSFTITNLTIANGWSDSGAGIWNNGGVVTAANCNFIDNRAQDYGGALYNAGSAMLINCSLISNSAVGESSAGTVPFPSSAGAAGGDGNGGAIANVGTLIMSACLLANNSASGGAGGVGSDGNIDVTYPGNSGYPGGMGGGGNGGALFNNGSASLVNTTFALNSGIGGQGGDGGDGAVPIVYDAWSGNGGTGGSGGSGCSAVYDVTGELYLTYCTMALNWSTLGAGGSGGSPGPSPNPPLRGNPGAIGPSGDPGSALRTIGAHLFNTLLSVNTSSNCAGTITDTGYNLSSDASFFFTANGSMNNTDPRLGPLANNGGPTLTMALLPGSPAIDAGSNAGAPATDQRGVARPQGSAVDIGAFEFQYIPVFTGTTIQAATNCCLQMAGLPPNETLSLLESSNLVNCLIVTNFMAGTNGSFQFTDSVPNNCRARFYRLKAASP
jgi:hypothetical protein